MRSEVLDGIRDAIQDVIFFSQQDLFSHRDLVDSYGVLIRALQEGRVACPRVITAEMATETDRLCNDLKSAACASNWQAADKFSAELRQVQDGLANIVKYESPHDTKNDIGEKARKNRRRMTKAATACAKDYRQRQRSGDQSTMKAVVAEYVENHGGSVDGIIRVLNDNPEQWKDDTKTT